MTITRVRTQEQGRQQAVDWQAWQAEQSLSYQEVINWQEHFKEVAQEYDLVDEFIENGII